MNQRVLTEDLTRICSARLPFEKLKNKTLLVTGAAGFFPAYLVESLLHLNQGLQVHALVRSEEKARKRFEHRLSDKNLKFIVQDVTAPLASNAKYDYIVHAASPASPKFYATDPVGVLRPNTIGTEMMLERAARDGAEFIYFSSSEVYGSTTVKRIKESDLGVVDPFSLRSCYAESKRMGETMCFAFAHQYKVPVKVVRPFHTYGPGMDLNDGRVFADFVKNILEGQSIALSSDGSAVRAYCYLADAIEGLLYVILKGEANQAFNLGNENAAISVIELAQTLVGLYPEKNLKATRKEAPQSSYMQSQFSELVPDTSKLRALGWEPRTGVAEGFRRTVESYL